MFQEKSTNVNILSVIVAFLSLVLLFPSLIFARDKEFEINCPYWYIWFDRAGYVDITYWHPSERHSYGPHEMMTGDWAAAVWYDGINNGSNQAQWLTDRFIEPTFDTTQIFDFTQPPTQAYYVENDPYNPVWTGTNQPSDPPYNPSGKYDSGWSKINDNKLQVKICYEIVDLGEYNGSPLAFRDANGVPVYVKSERYVLLQTYVFEALQAITGLEFYQMMHGHPTGIYYPKTLLSKCIYEKTAFIDPLSNYTPYDPNHQVGNFRYDITIWNTLPPSGQTNHFDWMSFSSTIEPNEYGLDSFIGKDVNMDSAIKGRNLNDSNEFSGYDIAGAMKWNIGDIPQGQKKSITLALMYGTAWQPPSPASLSITSDVSGCVSSNNTIHYNICYNLHNFTDTNVHIVAQLPIDIEPVSSSQTYDYNPEERTVTWDIPDNAGCINLTVTVTQDAEPGGTITTEVSMSGNHFSTSTSLTHCVDCGPIDVLYVDGDANLGGTGRSWSSPYKYIQTAITEAQESITSNCPITDVYVKAGIYTPPSGGYQLFNGLKLYGHFDGNEFDPSERNLDNPAFETILDGQNKAKVIQADNAADVLIDGFTIKNINTYGYNGIELTGNSNVSIKNCHIKESYYGLYPSTSTGVYPKVSLYNCKFTDNSYGIYSYSTTSFIQADMNLYDCFFKNNTDKGINVTKFVKLHIFDSIFDGNDIANTGLYASSDVIRKTYGFLIIL